MFDFYLVCISFQKCIYVYHALTRHAWAGKMFQRNSNDKSDDVNAALPLENHRD